MSRHLLTLLASLLAASLSTPPGVGAQARSQASDGTVGGAIRGRFEGELRPLSFALVEVVAGGERRAAVADSSGSYRLGGLPPGEALMAVSHAGYAPISVVVTVPEAGSLELDLELEARPVHLPAIEIVGHGVDETPAAAGVATSGAAPGRENALPEVELQALDLGPGLAQAGLADVVSALPGSDPADATDVLFMRGTTADLKLVLLDGVPVYTPFHVAGLMRSFEPGVLAGADSYVGGAPARFDGGLTHILDLRTRRPDRERAHFSGSVDLISAAAAAETPLGSRAGVLVAARSLHDLGSAPLGGARPYGYRDALVTSVLEPARGHEVRVTGFWNTESVALDPTRTPADASWTNRAASVRYRARLQAAWLDVTAGSSGYRAELPLQPAPEPGEPLPPGLLASAETERDRVVGELTWGSPGQPIRVGASLERLRMRVAAEELAGDTRATSRGETSAMGAFVDVTRLLAPGLTFRGGARVDHFGGSETRLAPRAALSWELSGEALLTVAAGRYHQATRSPHVEVERTLAELSTEGLPPAELLPVATADHVVLSLDQRLGERVRLGLEGFWKGFGGLPTAPGETVRSSGVDVRVLTAGDAGAVWLGYGLSWFWSTVDLSGGAAQFAGRHLLSAGVSGRLAGPLRGEARIAYGAGLPHTAIPFGPTSHVLSDGSINQTSGSRGNPEIAAAPIASGLDAEFLRVDLEVHTLLYPEVGGRTWQVRPYLRLLNALDRRDALFYTFQPWRSDAVRPLAEQAVLPLLGVAVSF